MDNKTYEEDFKMIRSAIDGAKNPMNQLGGFFKSYAIINMITVVLYLIVSLYQGFVREMYIGRMICFVYLAYYIFRMYKEEKSNTNHYYQAMLYIYGSVVVVIPVILWIAGIIGSFTLNNEASQAGKMLEMLILRWRISRKRQSMMRQQTLMRRFWIPGCGTESLKGNRVGVCSGCCIFMI